MAATTAICYACISPHPPIIVPQVGRGRERGAARTIAALRQLAQEVRAQAPETALLMATHGPLNPRGAVILDAPSASGDLSAFGAPDVKLELRTDRPLVEAVLREARAAGASLSPVPSWGSGLDWSVTVPLYYLRQGLGQAPVTPMNVSFAPPEDHFRLGAAVRKAIEKTGRRTVVIASADLSHRLSEDGPYGFDPAGPELDRRIQRAVEAWDPRCLFEMDDAFRERAGDDAVASISFLMGVLHGLNVRPRILSYEGPWGVGYMVAAVDIQESTGATPASRGRS
jgi:aromatic ring-opening dioxygenase LigB subunit